MSRVFPRMPCFESGFAGFHHTVDSALRVLAEMGVSPARISLRMDGRGYPSRWVVAQEPKPGVELGPGILIKLSIAGLGYFHALPVGMWDKGSEHEVGTQQIVELLDDPLEKARHWMREGARLFELRPDNFEACSRWISLFGLNPNDWAGDTWYNLALLLPSMQELAATEQGIRLVFELLLQLPIKELRFFPAARSLAEQERSLLGRSFCRLGVDYVLGSEVEDLSGIHLLVGPVSLATYYHYQQPTKKQLITSVLGLCTDCRRRLWLSWLVENPKKAPRLGIEVENCRLGINSHLGCPALVEA